MGRERDAGRQVGEGAGSKGGDRGIYASLERKPQAVHLERHGRGDHQKDRSRAGQDGANQTRIHSAQGEKESGYSIKLYKGHTTSRAARLRRHDRKTRIKAKNMVFVGTARSPNSS